MKNEEVKKEYSFYYRIAQKALEHNSINKAITATSVCAELQYQWNQLYKDLALEELICKIADKLCVTYEDDYDPDESICLFYDGFGFDLRGLAYIYLDALSAIGYRVIYVTCPDSEGRQNNIDELIKKNNITKIILRDKFSYLKNAQELLRIFDCYKPFSTFFYSRPDDVMGASVFCKINKKITRYFINLTDHAFWLGYNSFDYCIEFRDYGASISNKYREISYDKIIMLPFYPYINEGIQFQGFPFDTNNKKIVFSGGALYKTFDNANTYYRIVESILNSNDEVVFLYAGHGDTSKLLELAARYKDRVFHIYERSDLLQIMKRITLYLSTYPITGGLMTQYAAIAGKIPITLKHDNDSDGMLLDQENREIEYVSEEALLKDVAEMLDDPEYLKKREGKLVHSVISREDFIRQLRKIIDYHITDFKPKIVEYDLQSFKQSYIDRFSIQEFRWIVSKKQNLPFFPYLKLYYFKKLTKLIRKKK